jgi:chromosome segregation ATPase
VNDYEFRHENLQSEHNKLIAEVDAKKSQLEELQRQTKKLETDLAEHQNQYAEQSKCSHDLEERLCRENIGLAEWSL